MAAQTDIAIRVYRFFRTFPQKYETVEYQHPLTGETEYRARMVKGERTEVHWVEYGPLGSDKSVITARVKDMMAVGDMQDAQRNPTILIAAARWEAMRPMYENWLKGIEPTAEGVPLAAWAGVEQSIVELLRMRGIHTVQQLARLGDTHIQNFGVPGLRVYIDNAKTYLSTLDNQVIIDQLNQKDQQIADLADTVGELKAMLAQVMQAKSSGADPVKALDDSAFDDPDFEDPRAGEDEPLGEAGQAPPSFETPSQNKKRTRSQGVSIRT